MNNLCSIDDCSAPKFMMTWCKKHYYRWKRTGTTYREIKPIGYRAMHDHLNRELGKASSKSCYNCSKPAKQWAYLKNCEEELTVKERVWRKYCLHLEHYIPLCISCHKKFDLNLIDIEACE